MRLPRPIQNAVDLLLAELRLLRNGVQQLIDANRESQQVREQGYRPPPEVRAILDAPRGIETRKSAEDAQDERRYQGWSLLVQGVLCVATIGAFLAAAYYACYAKKQWKTMNDTYGEIKTQTTAAQRAAEAASRSADAAKTSVDNSDRNFRIQERPYVVVKNVKFDTPLKAGSMGIAVIVDNSGHTPALKVTYAGALYIDKTKVEGKLTAGEGESVIGSQMPTEKHYSLDISEPDASRITNNSVLKLEGIIRYTDIFNDWHPTTYCFVYDSKQKLFKFCPSGNDVR